jgi:hypothetical protein
LEHQNRQNRQALRRLAPEGIEVLEHVDNSPNMNAIEGASMPMRIAITQDWGAPYTLESTDRAWQGEWAKITRQNSRNGSKDESNQSINY